MTDNDYLKLAITKAKESVSLGGFPAGAVVVKEDKVIGEGVSVGDKLNDPTSHGEIASVRDACKNISSSDLSGSTLYASMQPCLMCLGASMWSGISRIVFACSKEQVSDEYYGGHYSPSGINLEFTKPLEILHLAELQNESLAIVHDWEKINEQN